MKDSIKKLLIVELVMIITIFLNLFLPNILSGYKNIIFLILILAVLFFMFGIDLKKSVKEKIILKNMLIYILSYFMIIYIFGLFIGFDKTIYHFGFTNIISNIIPTIINILLSELIRYELIKKSNNNKLITILSIIIFVSLDISILKGLYNFKILDDVYEFIGIVVIAGISKNILLTILCISSDYVNTIIYRLIMETYIYIVPIVPAFSPYISSVLLILFPIILSYMTLNTIKKDIIDKPNKSNYNKIIYFVIITIIIVIVLLNSGLLKYQTLTVGSDSMKNYLSKGDIILVDKISNEDKKKIKKGEILIFRYNKKIISHRVYEVIKKNNKVYYRTKGDNNNQVDLTIIETKDIIGVSKYRIKYLGLPSVWLKELIE